MQPHPHIAVITASALTGIGLKAILEKVIPMAEVELFGDFDDFVAAGEERFFHYFVAARIFADHTAFFRERRRKTILLTNGKTAYAELHSLDIDAGEESLVHDILQMHDHAHHHDHDTPQPPKSALLTEREIEVLRLVARGHLNKEIAEQLHIGLTTVISHRRNISEKLGIRSVAGLAIYAVRAGYADE